MGYRECKEVTPDQAISREVEWVLSSIDHSTIMQSWVSYRISQAMQSRECKTHPPFMEPPGKIAGVGDLGRGHDPRISGANDAV